VKAAGMGLPPLVGDLRALIGAAAMLTPTQPDCVR
jgi:hypothetical protein